MVDDDLDDQVIFLDALNEITTDVECITAGNGLQALSNLEITKPSPSLIFLDLNMPLMNGFECLKQMKNKKQYRDIPVVIFTTSNNPADEMRAKHLGAKLFFTKTPDFKLFKLKLHNILQTNFSGTYESKFFRACANY